MDEKKRPVLRFSMVFREILGLFDVLGYREGILEVLNPKLALLDRYYFTYH